MKICENISKIKLERSTKLPVKFEISLVQSVTLKSENMFVLVRPCVWLQHSSQLRERRETRELLGVQLCFDSENGARTWRISWVSFQISGRPKS